MSQLNNTFVTGRVTQSLPAVGPNDLIRLGEAQTLLTSIFQGAWNGTRTFTSGQMATDGGSLYVANSTTVNQQPSLNPSLWRLAAAGGTDGASVYSYIAYASDSSGTGFSRTPATGLNYVAFLLSPTVIATPTSTNFVGLWGKYIGADGDPGDQGDPGDNGASVFGYIAYASDTSGTGFSLTPGSGLNFVAFLMSPTVIGSPAAGNFTGLWKNYANAFTVTAPLTFSGGVLAINAASANTASYVVQRDSSGNFSAGAVTVTSLVVGSATISFSSTVNMSAGLTVPNLTITGLSGVLVATAGVVAGSATSNAVPEDGSVNVATPTGNAYFTRARVLATPLTGISSTNVLLATDTVLAAFGKIDNVLGGNFPTGTVSGNFSITGTLTVTGQTTLAAGLSGILKATSGVVSGSATTDNLPVGSTNLYWTQTLFNTAVAAIKNVANGIAPLDSSGKVPLANLYSSGATPYGAASQSAMLALSAAKQGDFALRSDTNIVYVLSNNIPSVLSNWSAFVYPVMSVNGATGAITLTTDNVAVGSTNLYWTQTLFNTALAAVKGAVSGVCPLDTNQLVPAANLPPIGNGTWIVNSQSAQTGLSSALKGDIGLRTDQNLTYILTNNTPTSFASWAPLLYPVSSVNGATGTVVLTTSSITEGSNLYFTGARVLASVLTGFTAGTGTVSSSDTVLSALQKVAANAAAALPLSGGTVTSTLNFSGTSNHGLVVNQLTTSQIGALAATSGFYGNLVYDTTLNSLKVLVNGSWVPLTGAIATLPLTAGSANPLTGSLYFQDGLSSYLVFGSSAQWSQRSSNSDLNFDFQQGGTTVLTLDTSNNVTIPNGVLKIATHQVVGPQSTLSLSGGSSTATGWTDSGAQSDFNNLVSSLRGHGLFA